MKQFARGKWDQSKKYHHWVATIQGWDDILREKLLLEESIKYMVLGKEIGETPNEESEHAGKHYQVFITFKHQKTWSKVKKY